MEYGLGRFADRRLEKGGLFFTGAWSKSGSAGLRFVCWAATALAR